MRSPLVSGGAAGGTPPSRRHPQALLATLAAAILAGWHGGACAQPSGATVVHGQALIQQLGNSLLVTTTNGAGTNHSAIDWRSFSVPANSIARFQQPSADSTSINRVTGGKPSEIFGQLSSNGHLVLVNPAGIAVGEKGVVDTAGFTASTLGMSDADAIAGRLRFSAGKDNKELKVEGRIIATRGDVVLLGTDVTVDKTAQLTAVGGDIIVAAGHRVQLTGRGIEGIVLELTSSSDRIVNLGTLEGDAVGLFASQLKHSGIVKAQRVVLQDAKVRLEQGGTDDKKDDKDKDKNGKDSGNGNSGTSNGNSGGSNSGNGNGNSDSANSGKGNSGNSGNANSGNGNGNSGNGNSGNSGSGNGSGSGSANSGNANSGTGNSGTGSANSGSGSSGTSNSGTGTSGNSGAANSGTGTANACTTAGTAASCDGLLGAGASIVITPAPVVSGSTAPAPAPAPAPEPVATAAAANTAVQPALVTALAAPAAQTTQLSATVINDYRAPAVTPADALNTDRQQDRFVARREVPKEEREAVQCVR